MTPAVAQPASLQHFCASRPQAGSRQPGCFPRQTPTFAEAGEVFAVVPLICPDTPLPFARRARDACRLSATSSARLRPDDSAVSSGNYN